MNWRCIFKGHVWGEWVPWWQDAPRIVRASLECLNDKTMVRMCRRCGKIQRR